MATLTAANSAFTLQADGVFPVPFALEGYGTDDAWTVDNVTAGEAQMGVDGKLSFGFIPYPTVITFTFQADSPTLKYLDDIIAIQKAQRELVVFNGTGMVQGTGNKYAMTRGAMIEFASADSSQKLLQPRTFQFTFQSLDKAPV